MNSSTATTPGASLRSESESVERNNPLEQASKPDGESCAPVGIAVSASVLSASPSLDSPVPADCPCDEAVISPPGAVGTDADRDAAGRFRPGNRAGLVVGQHSAAFWSAQAAARREIVDAIVADAGHTAADAPRALLLAAEAIAQSTLLQSSAFTRLVESGGPMTSTGRTRRAYAIWLTATDRLERQLRLIGLRRVPRPGKTFLDTLDDLAGEEAGQS